MTINLPAEGDTRITKHLRGKRNMMKHIIVTKSAANTKRLGPLSIGDVTVADIEDLPCCVDDTLAKKTSSIILEQIKAAQRKRNDDRTKDSKD